MRANNRQNHKRSFHRTQILQRFSLFCTVSYFLRTILPTTHANETMAKLLESSDEESENVNKREKLTINKRYAQNFEYRKSQEELYNNEYDDDSESESSSSEEEEEDISKDINFLETIKAIRSKDESIYKSNVRFFDDSEGEKVKKKKEKSMKIKDVLRREIVDQMDNEETLDPTLGEEDVFEERRGLMYDEEQQRIRNELLKEAKGEEDDDLFQEKKSKQNDKLLSKSVTLVNELQSTSKEREDGETFLLDYISKKRWMDNEFNYKDNDEDSLQDLEKQEAFESQYNFRFEEDHTDIPTYSRSIPSSLRREDDSRKSKREAKKQRKAQEKKEKEEQLKRLKNARKTELKRRIALIQDAAGLSNLENVSEDVWEDILKEDGFDEEKLEGVMERIFGEEYYDDAVEEKKDILKGVEDIIQNEDEEYDETYDENGYNENEEMYDENDEAHEEYNDEQDNQPNQDEIINTKMQIFFTNLNAANDGSTCNYA